MPRPLRYDPPGGRHHVMNRGARHTPVFRSDDDCVAFLTLIDDKAERYGVEVHAYALLPNHFHLLVVSNRGRLSDFMSQVLGGYARYLNQRPDWDGPVWRGRYKSRLVEEDAYWEYLVAYLHLNPVRAGLVDRARSARWTSLETYRGQGRALRCLRTDDVLAQMGGLRPMLAYMDDVQRKREDAPAGFEEEDLWRVPTSQPVPRPAPSHSAPRTAEEALTEVCEVTGTPREALFRYRRGSANQAAWIAAWWLQEGAGLTQREVGRIMGISQPGVAQRGRLLRKHGQEGQLAEWMAVLRDGLGR